jgi:hypothetical protein
MKRTSLAFGLLASFGLLTALPLAARNAENLTVLTIGGGPRPVMNQVAIESNVRYVDSLLPKSATVRTLFADGKADSVNVLYTEPFGEMSDAEKAFRFLFEGNPGGTNKLRSAKLREVNGASRKADISNEMTRIAAAETGSVLIYFTGHGEKGRNLENNLFALWEDRSENGRREPDQGGLSVRDLATEIQKVPASRPVTVVMVQCFSGSFGNVLFENGDPQGALLDRPICGFFATTKERVAAGCTPEINEAEYHDYTSYFYAALTGKDRVGRPVKPTDFNKDGIIGMDEAHLYALISEPSIDVPICTSDVFLRRFANMPDDDVAKMSYKQVLQMASPGQRAALEALSKAVNATGDDRLQTALADVRARSADPNGNGHNMRTPEMQEAIRKATTWRDTLKRENPGLSSNRGTEAFREARPKVIAALAEKPDTLKEILDAQKTIQQRSEAGYADELRGARWLRLMRLSKTVVLENNLRKSGDKDLIAKFDRLKALESQNPLRL